MIHSRFLSTSLRMMSLLLLLLGTTAPSFAQAPPARMIEASADSFIDSPAWVTTVGGRDVTDLAVSHPARKLVYARGESVPQILLQKLDDQGKPAAGQPLIPLTLPDNNLGDRSDDLVLSIVCHPSKPVLYVWRDVPRHGRALPRQPDAKTRGYTHLLVYDIAGDEPRLLLSACSGKDFIIGYRVGQMSLSADATRLYVPNLIYYTSKRYPRQMAMGYYTIDSDGLPILQGAEPEEILVPISGASGAAPAADAALPAPAEPAAEEDTDAAEAHSDVDDLVPSGRGQGLTMLHLGFVTGIGPIHEAFKINDHLTMALVGNMLLCYDTANRASRIAGVSVPDVHAGNVRLTLHPAREMAYIININSSMLLCWAHAQGYPSLMPMRVQLLTSPFTSGPLFVDHQNRLAAGGGGRVTLFEVDEHGWTTGKITQFKVAAARVSLMTSSNAFKRLYIATDAAPKAEP